MGMPEKRPPLTRHRELVDLGASNLQRALGYVCRPVCPICQMLENTMPAFQNLPNQTQNLSEN